MAEIIERENIWTLPNMLCVMRIVMSPYVGYAIIREEYNLALVILTVAGVTDFLDGWIARTFPNQASRVGSFLDPLADKVLITTLFLTLTYSGLMPIPLTLLVVTRDAILLSAGLYIRFHSLPPPRTFRRLVDLSHATAQLSPTLISKVNTAVQLITVGATLAATLLPFPHDDLLIFLWCFAASTTIASAMSYVFAKDTYVVLRSR
ncbi:cardiolipin synthase [Homalodisca vitripennis]|nr:cardiolipin synthase [Homalodisca vitripennis]KAG8250669.1 cardiolipin synthase [Homalodisca vitripennis]